MGIGLTMIFPISHLSPFRNVPVQSQLYEIPSPSLHKPGIQGLGSQGIDSIQNIIS